jgi:transposase-like protein|tara:strand:+ start:76 stop:447 length:372 start_codon:yes stop_codon:yes gene_type:complete
MSKRRNHDAGFKSRVALEALTGERTVSELSAEYGVHPTMIHQWKKALLEGAADIFERGGKKTTEVDVETVRSLHVPLAPSRACKHTLAGLWAVVCLQTMRGKIGELAVANDFLERKLKPWTGK